MSSNQTNRRGRREQASTLSSRMFNFILVGVVTITSISVAIIGFVKANAATETNVPQSTQEIIQSLSSYEPEMLRASKTVMNIADIDAYINDPSIWYESHEERVETTRLGVIIDSYDADIDYSALIIQALDEAMTSENPEHALAAAEIYEEQRNLKVMDIDPNQVTYTISHNFQSHNTLEDIIEIYYPKPEAYLPYTEEELIAAARIVYAEAGSDFITDEHQQAVASVLVNRVYDGRFGTGLFGVINRQDQYPTRYNKIYTERSLENARIVFENGPIHNGLYQSNGLNGTEIVMTFGTYGGKVRTTYICR